MAKNLTLRQREVLQFIADFKRKKDMPPTYLDICSHFGFASPNGAQEHVKALIKKGYLSHTPDIARGIKIIKEFVRI